jgi:type II secretory pathway pseudopilin PulG
MLMGRCRSGSREAAARRQGAAGFTLVEVIVAFLLFGVVMFSAVGLFMSQRAMYSIQTDKITVQQNVRAAVDLVAAELRTLPDNSVLHGRPDSVVVRYPFRWGLVCGPTGSGSPSPDAQIYLPTDEEMFAGHAQAGFAARDTAGVWTFTNDATEPWGDSASVGATVACLEGRDSVVVGDTAVADYLLWADFYTDMGVEAYAGQQIIVYGEVTYRFGNSSFDPGTRALFRITSDGPQELSGLFDDDAGFVYVLEDDSEHTVLPVGREDEVAAIRVQAFAVAPSSVNAGGEFNYDATVSVTLRNAGDT